LAIRLGKHPHGRRECHDTERDRCNRRQTCEAEHDDAVTMFCKLIGRLFSQANNRKKQRRTDAHQEMAKALFGISVGRRKSMTCRRSCLRASRLHQFRSVRSTFGAKHDLASRALTQAVEHFVSKDRLRHRQHQAQASSEFAGVNHTGNPLEMICRHAHQKEECVHPMMLLRTVAECDLPLNITALP